LSLIFATRSERNEPSGAMVGEILPATKSDEHLDDSGELVLRMSCVGYWDVTVHAKDVDSRRTLHRRTLSDRKEVVPITLRAARAAFGERQGDGG